METLADQEAYVRQAAFVERMAFGRSGELATAIELLEEGLAVRLDRPQIQQGPATDGEFADQTDIEVGGRDIIEVKLRRFWFTSLADFPFPTVLLGRAQRWEERTKPPCAVVVRSEPTGAKVVVSGTDRRGWKVEEVFDRTQGRHERSYACPLALARSWESLVAWLKR